LEGGWIDFARKIWGSARKMNSRTNMIKQDETRKLDYYIHRLWKIAEELIFTYLHLHCPFIINIRYTSFFIFWPLPEKLLDCPKKNYFARLWGAAAPQPPSSYAYVSSAC